MSVKKGIVVGRCLACGWNGDLDNNHKVSIFIVKNPPDESGHNIKEMDEKGGKMDKKARRDAKEKARLEKEKEEGGSNDQGSVESEEKEKEKKEKKTKKEKK